MTYWILKFHTGEYNYYRDGHNLAHDFLLEYNLENPSIPATLVTVHVGEVSNET